MSHTSYEKALALVHAVEAVQGPLPAWNPWERVRRPGYHTIHIETATQLGQVHSVLRRAWQQVRACRAFPRLQDAGVTQQAALRIMLLIEPLPASEREAAVERLVKLPLVELKRLRPGGKVPGGRAPKMKSQQPKPIGQRWHTQMVEIRQHLMALQRAGLIENLARSWSPPVRHGYGEDLRQVIAQLQALAQGIASVEADDVPMTPVLAMPSAHAPR